MIYDLVIVGAGPAGMMAAFASKMYMPSLRLALLERLDRVGGKLRYTAGGRANIAHYADLSQLISQFHKEQKFLYPAFNAFCAEDLIDFLASMDVSCYINDEGRVYPKNMNGKELEELFYTRLIDLGVDIFLSELVHGLKLNDDIWSLHCENLVNNQEVHFETKNVIVASGCPASKKIAASKSECYFAINDLSLKFVPLNAALAPLYSQSIAKANLSGISVDNLSLTLCLGKKVLAKQDGSLLFTHKGLSGPAILNISRDFLQELASRLELKIDFLPHLSMASFDFDNLSPKEEQFLTDQIYTKLPKRLRNFLFTTSHSLSEKIRLAKSFILRDLQPVDYDLGMQCRGGLATKELNPRTLECKTYANLYFVGDQLDLDGPEGGYNLMMAFSTGYLAGKSVAENLTNLSII